MQHDLSGSVRSQLRRLARPPRLFDTDTGQRTYDDFLDWSAQADELGFDWVSVSEHHYAPLIIAPSTGVMAAAPSAR